MFFLNPKFGNLRIISPFFTNYMGKRNIITLWSLEGVADGNEMGIASRNGNGNGNGNGNSAQTHQHLCLPWYKLCKYVVFYKPFLCKVLYLDDT